MSYCYYQATGDILANGYQVSRGYSGNGVWKNDPLKQGIKDHGPLPRGLYFMKFVDNEKGPLTIHLEPSSFNEMFGRGGFLVHGDNPDHIGESSDGCIVADHPTRQQMADSILNDNLLYVV